MAELKVLGIAHRIHIPDVSLNSNKGGFVYLRVYVSGSGRGSSLEIVDDRPGVTEAAEMVFEISGTMREARQRKNNQKLEELTRDLDEALDIFHEVFARPAIVSVRDMVTVGGRESYQQVILNEPEESDIEGSEPAALTVLRTEGGHWDKFPGSPLRRIENTRGGAALYPLFLNGRGARIYERDRDRLHVHRIFVAKEGTVRTSAEEYQRIVEKQKVAAASPESKPEPESQLSAPDPDLAENYPITILCEVIDIVTLQKYDDLGFKTVGDLSRADEKELKSATGLKIGQVRAHIRAAKNYIAARAHGE